MAKTGLIKLTTGTQSIANNTTPLTVTGIITTSGESYRGSHRTGTYTIKQGTKTIKTGSFTSGAPANSTTTLFSVSLTIYHDSDGSCDEITATYNYDSGWCTGSGSITPKTIPRQATITDAPNFTDEDNPKITYSNKAGTSMTTLQACIASTDGKTIYVPYRDISKTGTSYTFSFTDAEREALQNACVNAKSMDVRFYVTTVIAGVTYYSSIVKKLTIANAEPTLEVSVEDANTTTLALTGNKEWFVKYISNAKYVMTAAALKGATIKSYNVNCGDKSATSSSGTISAVESGTFVFTVTDSRGHTKTVTLAKTLVAYVPLTCVLATKPPSAEGDMDFNVSGTAYSGSFGSKSNEISVQYRYKSESDADYGAWTDLSDITFEGGSFVATGSVTGLDYTKQYTFQARITDSISAAVSKEYNIRVMPVFYWGKERFFFNVPVSIMGAEQDYIVEQGTDGIWTYRKWASGIAECWGNTILENVDCGKNHYSGFYYSDGVSIPFPTGLFIDNPTTMFDGGSQSYINFIRDFGSNQNNAYFLVAGLMDSSDATVRMKIQAKGRWK